MGLRVHVVKRKVLAGVDAGREKFYGQVRVRQTVSLDKFCKRVSANSSATPGDVELVINSMVRVVTDLLEDGHIVQLEGLGNMRLMAGSRGVFEKDKFKGGMMRRPRVVFTPGRLLSNVLDEVSFEWLKVQTVEIKMQPCPEDHTEDD